MNPFAIDSLSLTRIDSFDVRCESSPLERGDFDIPPSSSAPAAGGYRTGKGGSARRESEHIRKRLFPAQDMNDVKDPNLSSNHASSCPTLHSVLRRVAARARA